MKSKYRIILLSSSTGGHAIPLLEIYKEMAASGDVEPIVVHSGSRIERELFTDTNSIVCRSGKINRYEKAKNIIEFLRLVGSVVKSLAVIAYLRPNLIFSKGGFNGAPFLFWSKLLKIPYFLHESDSEMGAANEYFYRHSVETFVSFPISCYKQDKSKLVYSGFVLRDFPSSNNPAKELPLILITGGSQGATPINNCIFELLPELLAKYKVVHHIGLNDEEKVKTALAHVDESFRQNYEYFVFSTAKLADAMASSDLIISRAGSTIGEIAKLSKPSILIPYPYAASDHQTKNARYLERQGAAIIIKQDNLTPGNLLERIDFILRDKRNSEVIAENVHKALKTDGKQVVCERLLNYVRKK